MTSNDFDAWIKYHSAAFPSLKDWLSRHADTIPFWERPFADVDLRDAKAATDEMAAGTLDEPRGYGQHARVIAARARQIGSARAAATRVVDGQRVYGCPLCLDEGYVAVVDPIHWRAGRFRDCAVLCTCGEGDRRANARLSSGHRRQTPRYDARRMHAIDRELTIGQQRAEFQRWLDGGRVKAMAGYESGFDDYNNAR